MSQAAAKIQRCGRAGARRAGRRALPCPARASGTTGTPSGAQGAGSFATTSDLAEEVPEERAASGPPGARRRPGGGAFGEPPMRRAWPPATSTPVQSGIRSTPGSLSAAAPSRWRRARPSATRPRVTPEQRLEAFRKFVERSPDNPFARYSLAMGYRGAGRLDEAVAGLRGAGSRASRATSPPISCGARRSSCWTAAPRRPGCTTGASRRRRSRERPRAVRAAQAREALRRGTGEPGHRREEDDMSGLMQGKRAFVTGVANDRSIAWAIAEQFHAAGGGAGLLLPGRGHGEADHPAREDARPGRHPRPRRLRRRPDRRAPWPRSRKVWDSVDVLVHSIGFAPARGPRRPLHRGDHARGLAHHHGRLGLLAHRAGPRLPAAHASRARAS